VRLLGEETDNEEEGENDESRKVDDEKSAKLGYTLFMIKDPWVVECT